MQGERVAPRDSLRLGVAVLYRGRRSFSPEVEARPFDAPARLTMLTSTFGLVPMDVPAALDSYLGAPVRKKENAMDYPFDGGQLLHVEFDARGRVASLETTLAPK